MHHKNEKLTYKFGKLMHLMNRHIILMTSIHYLVSSFKFQIQMDFP